jgi:hypothetical protein
VPEYGNLSHTGFVYGWYKVAVNGTGDRKIQKPLTGLIYDGKQVQNRYEH